MANAIVARRWDVIRQQFQNCEGDCEQNETGSVSFSKDVSAELCVRLLSASSLQNFSGLKSKLQASSGQWIEDFIIHGGMEVLFQALDRLSQTGRMAFLEAFMQLECVNCIKAVMNSKQGLDSMTKNKTLVRNLAQGWLELGYFSTIQFILDRNLIVFLCFFKFTTYNREVFCPPSFNPVIRARCFSVKVFAYRMFVFIPRNYFRLFHVCICGLILKVDIDDTEKQIMVLIHIFSDSNLSSI